MSDLHRRLDEVYDPTDADKSSSVAHKSLSLIRYALMAVESHESGLRIGRDVATELSAHSMELAQALGLLSWHNLAAEREQFGNDLLGEKKQMTPQENPPPVVHGLQMTMVCIPPIFFCHCGASFPKRSLFNTHLQDMETPKP